MKYVLFSFYAAVHFYLLAFTYIRYNSVINGYLVFIPVMLSIICLVALVCDKIFKLSGFEFKLWKALGYISFAISYTFFMLKYVPAI
ncbi:hypothetical protein FUAX_42940 (plasmid) [Fulvitalea axinellae]|uniref:Uncharacterized protein n=1 Tax=Fulvitalea axinellae TaxID=1182444 RepID=A0AAU9CV52_9BACT|nr:hypothetical protein FUAX_42940 [Fulvitalea axinellae]